MNGPAAAWNPVESLFGRQPWMTEALDVDNNHAIRSLTQNWLRDGGNLTQGQWDTVRPRIVKMLYECKLRLRGRVGSDYRLATCGDAIAALDYYLVTLTRTSDRAQADPRRVTPVERDHIDATEWAVLTLMSEAVLVPRMQKIAGEAVTCQIG